MLSQSAAKPAQVSVDEITLPQTAEESYALATKNQFISFFTGKGFKCIEEAQQQLKATCRNVTVRVALSNAQVASDQGHAIFYLSIAPLNKRYKIVVGSAQSNVAQQKKKAVQKFFFLPPFGKQTKQTAVTKEPLKNAIAYTLLENTPSKSVTFMQSATTFYNLDDLLKNIIPATISFTGMRMLNSFFSFMFL